MQNEKDLSRDEVLLRKLTEAVASNLENEQFGVTELSDAVAISRFQLHRKLKLLKGKSVSQFIREVRLEEARRCCLLTWVQPQKYLTGLVSTTPPTSINWLEESYKMRFSWIPWIAWDPNLASLQDDTRFDEMLKRLNLPTRMQAQGNP
jgi:hypothetical protein